eukprot:Seg943.6 transcript_id=Seg943.6/GoldUCD/mRNA.D3Y31 product="E3 ubiquitin-protein ligase XIAP" protein_id=Seg943.6/GoldUCD/D3Y31
MATSVDYSKYENRLKTFARWPKDSPVYIKDLAEAGLSFTDRDDFVFCFECHQEFGDWQEGDVPLQIHENVSPSCKFLSERKKRVQENAPWPNTLMSQPKKAVPPVSRVPEPVQINPNIIEKPDIIRFSSAEKRKVSVRQFRSKISEERAQKISDAGLFYNDNAQCFECFSCHTPFDTVDVLSSDNPTILHAETFSNCKHIRQIFNKSEHTGAAEKVTLKSGDHHIITVENKEGKLPDVTFVENSHFNFDKNGRLMKINPETAKFRQVEERNSNTNERKQSAEMLKVKMPVRYSGEANSRYQDRSPDIMNRRSSVPQGYDHSPRLSPSPGHDASPRLSPMHGPFPTGRYTCSPLAPVSQRSLDLTGSTSYEHYTFGRQDSVQSNVSDEDIGNQEHRPHSPFRRQSSEGVDSSSIKSKYTRLNTFLTWPTDSSIQPLELVEAGFYYLKTEDGVKCYKCGVSLKNWERGDTAWGEHAKWSPSCPLVREHEAEMMPRIPGHLPAYTNDPERHNAPMQDYDRQHNVPYINEPPPRQRLPLSAPSPFMFPAAPNNVQAPIATNPINHTGFPIAGVSIVGSSNALFYPPVPEPFMLPNTVSPGYMQQDQFEPQNQQNLNHQEPQNNVQREEPIGPLSNDDICNLEDAGFSIGIINKVQKLGFEKNKQYFGSVETMADAIVYYMDNGNLDEHSIPKTDNAPEISTGQKDSISDNSESQRSSSGEQVDLKRELDKVKEMQLCKICMDEQVGVAFHPCGHLLTCPNCSVGMKQCPLCRAVIETSSRIYLS